MAIDLNDDVWIEILLCLENIDLKATFLVCRDFARFSLHPDLWQRKLVSEYGVDYLQYRLPNETYRDEYTNLRRKDLRWYWKAIREGRLYVLKALNDGKKITNNCNVITFYHKENIIRYVTRPLTYSVTTANNAVRWNQLSILNWLEQQGILPNRLGADMAAERGYLNILFWLQSRKILPTKNGLQRACRKGQHEVVKWLMDELQMKPDHVSARMAAEGGHLHLLKWLNKKRVSLTCCVDKALKNGHLEIVDWLLQRGHIPTSGTIDLLFAQGRLKELVWLDSKGIQFSQIGIERAINMNQSHVVKWAFSKGILPTKWFIDIVPIDALYPHLLGLFLEKGLEPSQQSINNYYQQFTWRDVDMTKMKLLVDSKLFPSDDIIKTFLSRKKLELLDYLIENSPPSVRTTWTSLTDYKHRH